MNGPHIPRATYRLQFNSKFTFAQAAELVPYLAELGISHCYASPYLRARSGSMHGYDIIDHNNLNLEIGTPEDFDRFVAALHEHGMGQILDIVPNHMGVMGSDNAWWLDVLENGQASPYADFFDIEWQPTKDELQSKVLVPVLGDQYGTVLDRGELKLEFDQEKGEFSIFYFQHRLPVNPREYPRILSYHLDRLKQDAAGGSESISELESVISGFRHLPNRLEETPEKKAERIRDKEVHKRRLAALCAQSPPIVEFVKENVREINGAAGQPESFEELHELIKAQAYRLAYWRVAADDINYRRFFDVNDLAGIRMENPAVFAATHGFVIELLRQGKLDGLRIDHPDGLFNPAQYFHRLQCESPHPPDQDCESKRFYVVVEKILSRSERLPEDWPVFGTTGYDFTNLVNGLFVDTQSKAKMDRIYRGFIGHPEDFGELVQRCKRQVMHRALASELNVLATLLVRIALSNRHTCDFTLNNLRDALGEVITRFPVYRTYITPDHVSETDRKYVEEAVSSARRYSAVADVSVFDFIHKILLADASWSLRESYHHSVVRFAMKFQQFTSVVMAKGVEDTSFYRYNRLISLNEVGGDPRYFGTEPQEFHAAISERAKTWPHSMLATSTHDTKRSEDLRTRIDVLSEVPAMWRHSVRRWRLINQNKKQTVDGFEAPSRNDEYFLYQTLIGAWPLDAGAPETSFCQRICEYMLKAVREAKDRTSWSNQNAEYEAAVETFVEAILSPNADNPFPAEFLPFQKFVARFGMFNSLAQTLLKLTAPGVPDLYQGTELWDLSLVDPDNRRAVDYSLRRKLLAEMKQKAKCDSDNLSAYVADICQHMEDGRIKLYVAWKTLNFRKEHDALFQRGDYLPLQVRGTKADHIVAFARRYENCAAIAIVPRLCARLLGKNFDSLSDPAVWENTSIEFGQDLSARKWRSVFSSRVFGQQTEPKSLLAAEVFGDFPVALLTASEESYRR